MTLGSLIGEDLRELEDLGLLPPEAAQDAKEEKEEMMRASVGGNELNGNGDKLPWFETLMEGSRLGKLSRTRRIAKARSKDASVRVEWEIVEWDDGEETNNSGKRKLGELDDGGSGEQQQQQSTDVEMNG